MADFRQLAIDFVLEEDNVKAVRIAQRAAEEIETASASSNPVARWVESVQPWMPGSDDDVMQDADSTPNWTGRAKALEFLSQTLLHLKPDTLKPSQVDLLVAFFGAMFDVDHKAGILASAAALSQIIAMKSFHPRSGKDIIEKLCKMQDDFSRQAPQTRLVVFQLLRSLIKKPEVIKDLRQRDGEDAPFLRNLVRLCASERYPDCLMVWFDILYLLLSGYPLSKETLEEAFGAFKAYFPITLPRAAQSGVTTEELKSQLRRSFSSTHQLASLALPFLIGKLDQGDGVTVNVKVDVLKTIKACLEKYSEPKESISSYTGRLWTSLKYEVRNGEIEDTIWATLEVLKTLASRLADDDLRDYTLTVIRDCVNDLATPMYTTSAGRLLVSVLSANPSTFVLMVAPTVTHIKENLRHAKSPTHSLDLLKILRIVLETRLLLTDSTMAEQERTDFAAVDGVFKTLYADIYRSMLCQATDSNASEEEFKLSTEAAQGVGALISQRQLAERGAETLSNETLPLLLPASTCEESSNTLFEIATQSRDERVRKFGADELVNETTRALQRVTQAFPEGFRPLAGKSQQILRRAAAEPSEQSLETIQSLSSLLAYIGCSSVLGSGAVTLQNFLLVARVLMRELHVASDSKASPSIWCAFVFGLHSAIRYLNDACLEKGATTDGAQNPGSWTEITSRYPQLASFGTDDDAQISTPSAPGSSISETRSDALLVSLYLVGSLYKRAVQPAADRGQLVLSDDFNGSETQHERRYLYLLSEMAAFVIHELSEEQQSSLEVEKYSINLFWGDEVVPLNNVSSLSWLTNGPLNVLSFGILEALRCYRVAKLYGLGVAQRFISESITADPSQVETTSRPIRRSILAILANKHQVESLDSLLAELQQGLTTALATIQNNTPTESSSASHLEVCLSTFAALGGLLRRYSGPKAQPLFQALLTVPDIPTTTSSSSSSSSPYLGHHLARGLELIVAPQKFLTRETFAVVKPLWLQKIYVQLVQPMLSAALGRHISTAAAAEPLLQTNYSIAVLLMIRHMKFSIYEDDADKIVRIAIRVAQILGVGADGMAALQVIKDILVESSDKAEDHIRSLVTICTGIFTNNKVALVRPDWVLADYGVGADSLAVRTGCGKLALEIVGGLPRMFEPRHLLAYEPQVKRDLSTACGLGVRDLRATARLARGAWADVK